MNERTRDRTSRGAGGGAVAGLFAGLVLAVFMLLMNVVKGQDVWMGMKAAGLPFLGERAMQPGFDALAVLVGVVCHFAVSAAWGALFGAIFYRASKNATIAWGLVWGIVVWLGMDYVVLPIVGLPDLRHHVPIGMTVFQHVLFGLFLAIGFLPYQRTLPREKLPPTEHGVPLPH